MPTIPSRANRAAEKMPRPGSAVNSASAFRLEIRWSFSATRRQRPSSKTPLSESPAPMTASLAEAETPQREESVTSDMAHSSGGLVAEATQLPTSPPATSCKPARLSTSARERKALAKKARKQTRAQQLRERAQVNAAGRRRGTDVSADGGPTEARRSRSLPDVSVADETLAAYVRGIHI